MPSPTYEVISQVPFQGLTRYLVRLVAENGYSEEQEYVGDEATLADAQDHFSRSVKEAAEAADVLNPLPALRA